MPKGLEGAKQVSTMTPNPIDRMTIPELLEARAVIRGRLEMGTGGAPNRAGTSGWNNAARDKLLAELQEIQDELAEQGHKDA
ncbi:MAG TPA: hypothetical protein VNU97_08445 [Rhizomicrobium sp.]|jgi:hypothetical protein|nr:hypothetical protein [Rhizomicrobium sp.]